LLPKRAAEVSGELLDASRCLARDALEDVGDQIAL